MLKYFVGVYLCFSLFTSAPARTGRRKGIVPPFPGDDEDWTGKWFPYNPAIKVQTETVTKPEQAITICDDVVKATKVDYDPSNHTHSYNFLCLNNRTLYKPHLNRTAELSEQFIPPAYSAPIKCLNESIEYAEPIPTFGGHRMLPAKYGEYRFLPPQRWLKNLADGGIVMLYHPCAFPAQINALKHTVKSCLYRHIITPSQNLPPEWPLALLAWGKILKLSVVDEQIVADFIKGNAKHLANRMNNQIHDQLYDVDLLSEAHLITDENDQEICGYMDF